MLRRRIPSIKLQFYKIPTYKRLSARHSCQTQGISINFKNTLMCIILLQLCAEFQKLKLLLD